jgi:uncharacterized OsmC-like protein
MDTIAEAKPAETIEGSGFPLAFKFRHGAGRSPVLGAGAARDVFVTEARAINGYQKEGIVHEGEGGSVWRLTTDEGLHLGGHDVAPFPLGFYNAGLHGDFINRMRTIAAARNIAIDDFDLYIQNGYYVVGSFIRGDGKGHVEPSHVRVRLSSSASPEAVKALVDDAIKASPAFATMSQPLTNTFAIYVNGRRRVVTSLTNSDAPDAADPYRTYGKVPSPLAGSDEFDDIIWKTGETNAGEIQPAVNGTDDKIKKIVRTVNGDSEMLDTPGATLTDTVLGLDGMSHFQFKSDERPDRDQAPCGLSYIAAGIAFCYLTQLERYTIHQKFNIRGARLVQYTPFTLTGDPADGSWTGGVAPADTHLFLSGDEDEDNYERLMTMAANVCYLHATLADAVQAVVSVELNGKPVA